MRDEDAAHRRHASPAGHPGPTASGDREVSIVTVSYRGDVALARELCRSLDAHLDERAEHVLVVPRADLALFEPLASTRRRIVVVEDVLPSDYRRLPVPQSIGAGRFRRRIREMWLTPVGVVRGWIIQQIVKLSAPAYTQAQAIVFADSDIELIARLDAQRLHRDGATRFYRVPDATADSEMHGRWHSVAAQLIGLEPRGYTGADFIGNLITWRRDVVLQLQDRVATVGRRRWDTQIARQRAFSEYILYGVFADQLLPGSRSLLFETAEDLVHAGWFYDLTTPDGLDAFVGGFAPGQVGVAIQSTESFTLDERRRLVSRITAAADQPHR